MKRPLLLCVVGPTAVGKTSVGIRLAARFGTEILSVDARQVYHGLHIGSNQPSSDEQRLARHHLINFLPLEERYTAARYERDALQVLEELFRVHPVVVAVGGTGFYLKALLAGLDRMPDIPPAVREALRAALRAGGLPPLVAELREKDARAAETMDLQNPSRVLRALEVIRSTGKPFSSFHGVKQVARPFDAALIGLALPRETHYARINARTWEMLEAGWLDETQALLAQHAADCPGLQTIGYPELIRHLKGELTLAEAAAAIQQQTRHYAKRQLTWFRGQHDAQWFHPADESAIFDHADSYAAAH